MRRSNRFVGGALLGSLLLLCGVATGSEAFERKDRTPQIRVVGRAAVAAAPDRVSLDVAVVTRAQTASQAATQNAEATANMLASLRTSFPDAAELSTRGYTLSAEYNYDKREGKRTPAGFVARNTVHVSLDDVKAAGKLIDAAVESGANEVQAVRFSLVDSAPLLKQALAAATADARAKAEVLAESMGGKLGKPIRVEESGAGHPRPQMALMAREASRATPIEPGDVFVEASVSLWMELKEK